MEHLCKIGMADAGALLQPEVGEGQVYYKGVVWVKPEKP